MGGGRAAVCKGMASVLPTTGASSPFGPKQYSSSVAFAFSFPGSYQL